MIKIAQASDDNPSPSLQTAAAYDIQNQLLEALEQAVIVTDVDGRILYWNNAAEHLYGWQSAEVIGRGIRETTLPHMSEAEVMDILAQLHRGVKWSGDVVAHRRDGEQFWAHITDLPMLDADGRLISIVAVSVDITERKRVEEQLQTQAETIATINQIGQLLSAELDLHKLVQLVTDAATQLSGAQFGAFFYNSINEAGDVYQLYTLSGASPAAFAKFPLPRDTHVFGPTFRNEGVIRSSNIREDPRYGKNAPYRGMPAGHLPVTSYLAVPVVSRSGEVLGGLFFGHPDPGVFSERVEQIVVGIAAQTAIAMDNARLYEEARRAIRLRDQFLSLAAHELKTPLTSILVNIELFQRRNNREKMLNERDQRTLQTIADQTNRLNKMVLVLLDVSRIESGQLSIERVPVDICALVKRVIGEVQFALGEREFQLQCSSEPLIIQGDELRLDQVFQNLIQNAVKYSHAASPIVVVVQQRGEQVCVEVRDTGIGIPQTALPHLFERFYRATNVNQDMINGLGIGLYVVKEIVELHGGQVHVESTEGAGSTFSVCFPIQAA